MDTHSPVNAVDDNTISNLESSFGGLLHIQDAEKSDHVSEEDDIGNCHVGEGHLCEGFEQQTKLKMKCLIECPTFPYPDMKVLSGSSDEDDTSLAKSLAKQSPRQSYSCSVSLPAPPKPVSAMKGSREKQGGLQMKLTVKWAPDVYDPVPTLLSHTVVKSKKQQKSRIKKSEKKNGKKGQKSNYYKGGSCKEKKQHRYRWPESWDKVNEASTEFNDLDAVSHDSYNGISKSKKPASENHCHVGEALSSISEFVSYIKTA